MNTRPLSYPLARLVVLDLEDSETKERNEEPEKRLFNPYTPFTCGQRRGSFLTGGSYLPSRCKSRGCRGCHSSKLSISTAPMMELKRRKGSRNFAIVFTPKKKVMFRSDVDSFLSGFRKLLRYWRDTKLLDYGYWVAEYVPDFNVRTFIPCPVRTTDYNYNFENYVDSLEENLQEIQHNCRNGISCPYCDGSGFLPSGHLHIHMVVSGKPFYWGEGRVPKDENGIKLRKYQHLNDFGSYGFKGACDKYGLGVSKVEHLRHKQGFGAYISKASLVYISKVSGKKVNWDLSSKSALIASAIYDTNRHRGPLGKLYGLEKKRVSSDMGVYTTSEPDTILEAEAFSSYKNRSERTINLQKEQSSRRESWRAQSNKPVWEFLRLGKSAIKRNKGFDYSNPNDHSKKFLGGCELNVLHPPKLDAPVRNRSLDMLDIPKELISWDEPSDSISILETYKLHDDIFSDHWKDTPMVTTQTYWFYFYGNITYFGKGGSIKSFSTLKILEDIRSSIPENPNDILDRIKSEGDPKKVKNLYSLYLSEKEKLCNIESYLRILFYDFLSNIAKTYLSMDYKDWVSLWSDYLSFS
jgi:hypothetical protein